MLLGNKVPSHLGLERSVIGGVESSPNGQNVIIRVGRTVPLGWTGTEHVVLTKAEAGELVVALLEQVIGPEAVEAIRAQEIALQAVEKKGVQTE